ncbi:hypothetical protein [Clostridium tagluense]|nr:hypothetical protein [Clostridium tagluense]
MSVKILSDFIRIAEIFLIPLTPQNLQKYRQAVSKQKRNFEN